MAWFFRGAEYSHLLLTSMGVASGLHSEKNKTTSICMPYLRAPQLVYINYVHTMPNIKVLISYVELVRITKIKLV